MDLFRLLTTRLITVASLFACVATPQAEDTCFFTDVAEASGLDFVHFNGMSGEFYFPEMTGQGCGFLDYDNDGDLDAYLPQGCMLGPEETHKDALFPPRNPQPRHRLYRNELSRNDQGKPVLRFVDVTDEAGIHITGYGMGVAAADFNNDGWVDLYVTNYGPNNMLFNNGDGTFRDVTAQSGTGDTFWGASAAAFDYDKDGYLDLYLTNYVLADLRKNRKCYATSTRRDYCGPSAYPPQRDVFWRNRGDGTFEDVTHKVLVDYVPRPGLGVSSLDVNEDGWLDILVANDGEENQLWINNQGESFQEEALFSGTAVNQDGQAEASMGVAIGDFDQDGDEDIFLTHLMGETSTLYVNEGGGLFEDQTNAMGLSAGSFPNTAFGVNWIDCENDGWLDLIVFNGAVRIIEKLAAAGDRYPIHQPNNLFHNEKGKRFTDLSDSPVLRLSEVSRGAAFGDVDNDGDTDVLLANNNGPVRLLQNELGQENGWIGLRLCDAEGKRDLLGALAGVRRKGLAVLWRRVRTCGSYCSANDARLLFGLGKQSQVESVEIIWPDGAKEVWKEPLAMQYTTLRKGFVNHGSKR